MHFKTIIAVRQLIYVIKLVLGNE